MDALSGPHGAARARAHDCQPRGPQERGFSSPSIPAPARASLSSSGAGACRSAQGPRHGPSCGGPGRWTRDARPGHPRGVALSQEQEGDSASATDLKVGREDRAGQSKLQTQHPRGARPRES